MAITVTQLTAFLAVIRSGSVTAAARELGVTQPSVSSALAALSRELDCELFERDGRGVRATDAGREFEPYATDVVGLLDRGRRAAREAADAGGGLLRIAAVTTAAESFVPELMHAYAEANPQVQLELVVGNRRSASEAVLEHRADLAITGFPPDDERLSAERLHANEIVMVTAPGDEAAAGGPIPAAAMAGRVWLLREHGSGTRALNERFLAEHGLSTPTLTLGSTGAIKQAARAGLGVSLVSRVAVEAELSVGLLAEVPLLDGPTAHPWVVVYSAVGAQRPSVVAFKEFVRERAAT